MYLSPLSYTYIHMKLQSKSDNTCIHSTYVRIVLADVGRQKCTHTDTGAEKSTSKELKT